MRFMLIQRADKDTEAGVLPSEQMLAAMMKYEMVKAGVMLQGEGLHASAKGARVKFGRQAGRDRRALHRDERAPR